MSDDDIHDRFQRAEERYTRSVRVDVEAGLADLHRRIAAAGGTEKRSKWFQVPRRRPEPLTPVPMDLGDVGTAGPSRHGRSRATRRPLAFYAALTAAIIVFLAAPAALAVHLGLLDRGSSVTAPCTRAPRLELPEVSDQPFKIRVIPGCKPPDGAQWWIVVELSDVGDPPHSEYYFKWRVSSADPYELDSTVANPGTRRTYYIVEVSDAEYAALQSAARSDGLVLVLGDALANGEALVVSNKASNRHS